MDRPTSNIFSGMSVHHASCSSSIFCCCVHILLVHCHVSVLQQFLHSASSPCPYCYCLSMMVSSSVIHDPAAVKICVKHVLFEVNAPHSFYKILFQGMSFGMSLSKMSSEKVGPTGFKHQECECRRGREKAPIQYGPERDPV